MVSTEKELNDLMKNLGHEEIISLDTEFIRESTFFPTLELIQIGTDKDSWLIDVQAFRKNSKKDHTKFLQSMSSLVKVLKNKKIIKVLHAAQADQECFYSSFSALATPIFDTALAASLCGLGDNIGLANLLKSVLDVNIKKGFARTNWSVRPLPKQLQDYAHTDVIHLVELANRLFEKLDKLGRKDWAFELSAHWEDKKLYEVSPEEITAKLMKTGKVSAKKALVLLDLVKWREKRVRELNVPRRWLADDKTLLDVAQVCPKTKEELFSFRGLQKAEINKNGNALLDIIKVGLECEDPPQFKFSRAPIPTPEEKRAVDLLKCYIAILADENKIAKRHLIDSNTINEILRSEVKSVDDLIERNFLTPGAANLIGKDFLLFLNGKRGLVVNDLKVGVITPGKK